MFQHVARAPPKRLLFRTHAEASALFHGLARAFPEAVALAVLPEHVRLVLPHADPAGRLPRAMSGYARWRNHARGEAGPVWAAHFAPRWLPNAKHTRRAVREVHLAACRAALVGDPLAWPYSSHRDAVGFAARPIRRAEAHPARFHAWVSAGEAGADDVPLAPSALPGPPWPAWGAVRWGEIVDAVGGVCRVAPEALRQRGPPRTLAVRTGWAHGIRDLDVLAATAGIEPVSVERICERVPSRGGRFADPALEACVRAVGDPRFTALVAGDLLAGPTWGHLRDEGYR